MAQSAPVDTIETDAAQGDFGALAGGVLDGIAGIFGGIIDGIGGLISGIFGGGGSYGGGSYGGGSYGGGSYGSGSYGGGSGGGSPVVLDLSGKGINITPLSSSNMFFGMANDGYAQHTAWAGAGNGVLVYDPSGGAGHAGQPGRISRSGTRRPRPTCRRCRTCSTPTMTAC